MTILGVKVDSVTDELTLQAINQAIQNQQKLKIATVNPEIIIVAQKDEQYRQIINKFGLCLPDGIGVMWAANLQARHFKSSPYLLKLLNIWFISLYYGFKTLLSIKFRTANLPQQVSGSSLTNHLAKQATDQGHSIYLLGGPAGVAQRAADNLHRQHANLTITGYFDGDGSTFGDQQSIQQIRQNPADIVLVAYGAPKQELWIDRNIHHIPASVAIGVGGTFSFLAGDIRRAPKWVQRIGFEWLFRLFQQPWRWRRQLALPKFIWAVTMAKVAAS